MPLRLRWCTILLFYHVVGYLSEFSASSSAPVYRNQRWSFLPISDIHGVSLLVGSTAITDLLRYVCGDPCVGAGNLTNRLLPMLKHGE
ncbi:hypothetical protein JB92DRAFT_3015154 [Gautieria morchelliformis]|nr:hypothetical protein JB92DRAFT_3015154 [Gautieria morchelliformis]